MNREEVNELASELFDPDLPNVVTANFAGCPDFYGSLSREHIETDEIVGVRSVFLASSFDLAALGTGDALYIAGDLYYARIIQARGVATTAVVLGK